MYFKDSEYKDKPHCDLVAIQALELFREYMGIPMILTADYASTGHSQNSWHSKGKAFDLKSVPGNPFPLWDFIFTAQRVGFRGIGIYLVNGKPAYAHIDIRDTQPTIWIAVADNQNDIKYSYVIGG